MLSRDSEAIKSTIDSLPKQYNTQRHLGLQCDVSQVLQVKSLNNKFNVTASDRI